MRPLIAFILARQSERFLRRVKPLKIAIVGSVGKTSTTQAIATVLEEKHIVRKTIGNYNTDVGVPCSLFGVKLPKHLKNPFSWLVLFVRNELKIVNYKNNLFDIAVLEFGTDKPGEIAGFRWVRPDVLVVTAIAPEHMEAFVDIDAVAHEELALVSEVQTVFINADSVDRRFYREFKHVQNYTNAQVDEYVSQNELKIHGTHSLSSISAAISVACHVGLSKDEIKNAVIKVSPQKGRMNKLDGIFGATIIDDTYNASPEAVKAALLHLNETESDCRIALLGNMNELGDSSVEAHKEIGQLCTPDKLALLVTLGPHSNSYLADEAEKNGCLVKRAYTPYEAGTQIKDFLQKQTPKKALVLCKGSQNGVYAEEAVKLLLKHPSDSTELVRQSTHWLKKKEHAFKRRTT